MTDPQTEFDWAIYANATFAGLAVLIPIPIIDWLFEEFFRRRIPGSIAKRRGHELSPVIIRILNKYQRDGCLKSLWLLPVKLTVELIKRISRKILYFLTIKEATDKVSYYWHQAFLVDYALLANCLKNEDEEGAEIARQAIADVLETITTSPLLQLSQRVTTSTRHILRTLLQKVRSGDEDDLIEEKKSQMVKYWGDFAEYFEALAGQYDQTYQAVEARREIERQADDDQNTEK